MSEDKTAKETQHDVINVAILNHLESSIDKLERLVELVEGGEHSKIDDAPIGLITLSGFLSSAAGSINDRASRIDASVDKLRGLLF